MNKNNGKAKQVYCYETKEKFESYRKAEIALNLPKDIGICKVLDNPNKIAGGYHWCSTLDIFDNIELGGGRYKKSIYCYETKDKFDSLLDAAKSINYVGTSGIIEVRNNPARTAGGYHWCTDLSIFNGVELTNSNLLQKVIIYNYETKEKFNSIREAVNKYKLCKDSGLGKVLDNPYQTCGGYHWCTDLDNYLPVKEGTSKGERELRTYIESFGYLIRRDRQVLDGKEIDIYIEELKLGFEYNGNYWHSEEVLKHTHYNYLTYHEDKVSLAASKGVKLIHIWESGWKTNREYIEKMIRNEINNM